MSEKQGQIRQLMIEKLTGIISYDDGLYLEDAINKSRKLAVFWQEMQASWAHLQIQNYLSNCNPDQELATVKTGFRPKTVSDLPAKRTLADTLQFLAHCMKRKQLMGSAGSQPVKL